MDGGRLSGSAFKRENRQYKLGEGVVGSPSFFDRAGLNRTIRPVTIAENMTIKRRTTGLGLKRPGDGMAASVLQGMFVKFWAGGGLGTAILRPGG